jgi:hypothetical protein
MEVIMSILDRYARLPMTERRTKSVGSKLEPSLYESFVEHCTKRGLTTSEALRYIIMELIQDEGTNSNQEYQRLPDSNKTVTDGTTLATRGNLAVTKVKSTTNNPGKTGSMTKWMVNNKLPCPICRTWGSRQNYRRDHAAKHGYSSGYELIQANLGEVERMVTEREQVRNEE